MPSKEIVQMKDVSQTCNDIGVGADIEPQQVQNISMFGRIFLAAMVIYNVGVTEAASRYDMLGSFIDFLTDLAMEHEIENTNLNRADALIEELYSGAIVVGGTSAFGRVRGFNRDRNPHAVSFIVVNTHAFVLFVSHNFKYTEGV